MTLILTKRKMTTMMNEQICDFQTYYVQTGIVPGFIAIRSKSDAISHAEHLRDAYGKDIKVMDTDFKTVIYTAEFKKDQQ